MGKFSRKLQICINKGCGKCPLSKFEVESDDCEYALKHVVSFHKNGQVQYAPRRSGKTTKIIDMANKCAEYGYPTYLLVPTHQQARLIKSLFGVHKFKVFVAPKDYPASKLRGAEAGVVFSDEVSELVASEVQHLGHHFLFGYTS